MWNKIFSYGKAILLLRVLFLAIECSAAVEEFPITGGIVSCSMQRLPSAEFFERHKGSLQQFLLNRWSAESAERLDLKCFDPLQEPLKTMVVRMFFVGQQMEAIDAVRLSRSLNLFPELRALDLSDNKIGLIGLGALAGGFRHIPNLEELYLRAIGAETINVGGIFVRASEDPGFGSLIRGLSQLKILDLSRNEFSATELRHFISVCKTMKNLDLLYLEDIGLKGERAFQFVELVREHGMGSVQTLYLGGSQFTEGQRKAIQEALPSTHVEFGRQP